MSINIPFGRPILGDEERSAMNEVLSGHILTHGPKCAEFEQNFAERIGVKHAITTSNCTTALHLSLVAHDIGPGDEVIVPAMTHVATAHAVEHAGAKPVFSDVCQETGCIDPKRIEEAITPKTRAIMVVHYLGLPCDMDEILAIANRHNIPVIEDCATAIGASFDGRAPGQIGATGCFSFYPTKHMTTLEGGMLTTNDDTIAERVRKQRAFGYDKGLGERNVPGMYDIAMLGWNYRMSEGHAAVGLVQLTRLEGFLKQREKNAEALLAQIAELNDFQVFPFTHGKAQSSWYCFNITLSADSKLQRVSVIEALNKKGIGTSVHYPVALPFSKYYSNKYPIKDEAFPVARWIANHTISLPCGPHLQEEDMIYIGHALKGIAA